LIAGSIAAATVAQVVSDRTAEEDVIRELARSLRPQRG
jgi:hypothetical protein